MKSSSSMPFGAQVLPDGAVRFGLWAPKARRVELHLENRAPQVLPMARSEGGWFQLTTAEAAPGTHYRFQIDGTLKVPDPASRFQPFDVHGSSEVIDPNAFDWQDDPWQGRRWEEAAIYELHVGTFSPEGTFRGVEGKLDYLCELGVTAIELMPIADFPGGRNWGYDGVLLYAPDSSYGRPQDLKRLVQAAHARELMILLDVVYNHFGPEGNYLHALSPQFFTGRHHTPWGDAINFDGPDSRVVRDFFIHNVLYWLEEYHLDGLRLDAVHAIVDDSTPNILAEIAQTVRSTVGDKRLIHLILENGDNAARYLRRDENNRPCLYTAQWNDDIHHALHVLLTGESDGYYSDYFRKPVHQVCRCLTEGFAYQGEYSEYHKEKRGEPSADLPSSAFVSFLQNHDQVGNRAFGERLADLAPSPALKAAIEILLLSPLPPMLFMGEEFGAKTPFLYFCDYHGELAAAVTRGRRDEFARFANFNSAELRDQIPDPNAPNTYLRSKLNWDSLQCECHRGWLEFYRRLLSIRQRVIVPHLKGATQKQVSLCNDQDRTVSLDWKFPDGAILELRANLGNSSLAGIMPRFGKTFYSSTPEAEIAMGKNKLPAWSTVWSLRS